MPLFEGLHLHLLLFLVASMNRLSYRTTNWAAHILASVVVAEDVSRAYAMRNKTFLVLAFSNMLP
jgi:hypothetical protein